MAKLHTSVSYQSYNFFEEYCRNPSSFITVRKCGAAIKGVALVARASVSKQFASLQKLSVMSIESSSLPSLLQSNYPAAPHPRKPPIMASGGDARLLKSTKFPPEFSQKVDMKKVNLQVMKKLVLPHVSMHLTTSSTDHMIQMDC